MKRRTAMLRRSRDCPARAAPFSGASALVLASTFAVTGCGGDREDRCAPLLGALCDPGILRGGAIDVDDAIAADVDGDGRREVIVASRRGRSVSLVREGAPPITIALPGEPSALAAADFDGDGVPEVAVALADAGELRIIDDLAGAARVGAAIAVGVDPRDLWAGDLDRDGVPDLVTADAGDGAITVIRGSDRRATRYPAGATPVALDVGDLDGDGWLDLVVVDFEGGALHLLRGGEGAEFAADAVIEVGLGIEWVDLEDLDGDGDLDALVRGRAEATTWRCDGDGDGLGPAIPLDLAGTSLRGRGIRGLAASAGAPGGVLAAQDAALTAWFVDQGAIVGRVAAATDDLELDLVAGAGPDLVAAGPRSVALGSIASPSFIERWRLDFAEPSPPGPAIRLGLDDDGLADVAAVRGATLLLLRGQGGGAFEVADALEIVDGVATILVGDVTGDLIDDLVLGAPGSAMQVARGLGDGVYEPRPSLPSSAVDWALVHHFTGTRVIRASRALDAPLDAPVSVGITFFDESGDVYDGGHIDQFVGLRRFHLGDLDGDGDDDMVVHYGDSARSLATFTNAVGERDVWEDRLEWFVGAGDDAPDSTLGDLDGDGRLELLLIGAAAIGRLDDLDRAVPSYSRIGDAGLPFAHPVYSIVDVDGDGRRDLIATQDGAIAYTLQGEDGTFGAARAWWLADAQTTSAIAVNGDGWIDVIAQSPGAITAHFGGEWGAPDLEWTHPLPGPATTIVSGDFDGDGGRDLALLGDGTITLARGEGGGAFSRATAFDLGLGGSTLARADLDGDGIDELLTASAGLEILRLVGDGLVREEVEGLSDLGLVDQLLARDLDADGDEDLVVILRPEPGTFDVAIAPGVGDGSLRPPARVLAGIPRRRQPLVSVGDLDGDGRPELAISDGGEGSARILWPEPGSGYRLEETAGRKVVILGDEGSLIALEGDRLRRRSGRGGRLGDAVTVSAEPRLRDARLHFAADVDGDGRSDLVLWSNGPTIRRADAGAFPELLRLAGSRDLPALVDDLDGDGRPDLVLQRLDERGRGLGFELRLSGAPR